MSNRVRFAGQAHGRSLVRQWPAEMDGAGYSGATAASCNKTGENLSQRPPGHHVDGGQRVTIRAG